MGKQRKRRRHADLSKKTAIQSEGVLVDIVEQHPFPLLLVLDNIQDPHNLGACLRTADAAGAQAVVAPRDRAVSLTGTVRRIASGAAEHVPFIQVTNLARTLRYLKEHRIHVLGTADGASKSLFEADLNRPLAIVMGSEGQGMRRLTGETCDELVRIPMGGAVDCLNVSVAAGVCLFEALRQRGLHEGAPPLKKRPSLKPIKG